MADPVPMLLGRVPPGAMMAFQLRPGEDGIEAVARLQAHMDPDHLVRSEWCVVNTTNPRVVRWPDPEPWVSHPDGTVS